MTAADVAQQFRACGWGATAASELADIHLALQAKQAAAEHAARATRLAAEAATASQASAPPATLPPTATGRAFRTVRALAHGAGQWPHAPLVRLALAALVSCLLLLTACGGGGDAADLVAECKAAYVGPIAPDAPDHPCNPPQQAAPWCTCGSAPTDNDCVDFNWCGTAPPPDGRKRAPPPPPPALACAANPETCQ